MPIPRNNIFDEIFDWFSIQAGDRPRILIAEDDVVSRRVLEATLVGYGFQVLTAQDGAEACRLLEAEDPPHLVILDLNMPNMDGLEVCKWIRSTPRLKLTYIILLTSKNTTGDVVIGLQAGADDYI